MLKSLKRICIKYIYKEKAIKETPKDSIIAFILRIFNKKKLERCPESRSWMTLEPVVKSFYFILSQGQ